MLADHSAAGYTNRTPKVLAMAADIDTVTLPAARTQEDELRRDMAAVFRVAARLGWNEQIGNHNSAAPRQTATLRVTASPRRSATNQSL
jgi:hypothetical protein